MSASASALSSNKHINKEAMKRMSGGCGGEPAIRGPDWMRGTLCKRQSEKIIDATASDLIQYKRSVAEHEKERLRRESQGKAKEEGDNKNGLARWVKKMSNSFVVSAEDELEAWEQKQEDSKNNMSLSSFDAMSLHSSKQNKHAKDAAQNNNASYSSFSLDFSNHGEKSPNHSTNIHTGRSSNPSSYHSRTSDSS